MGSTRVSRVLDESGQKSTRIEICKNNLIQPEPVISQINLQVSTHFYSSNN